MVSRKVDVAVLLLLACSIDASVIAPAIAPVAPIAYTRAVPYNVLPFANSVNVFSKTLSAPLVAAYGVAPAIVKAPFSAVAPALAPVPAIAHAFPAQAFGHAPAFAPALAPAPAPLPALRVSSFLPAPFAPAPAVLPAASALAAPVVRNFAPSHLAPAAIAPAHFAPDSFHQALGPAVIANAAIGRAVHAVNPAAVASPVVPAPSW